MNEDVSIIDRKRQFRSRLNSLPLELKCEIGEIPLQKGLRATSRKEKVIELLWAAGGRWVWSSGSAPSPGSPP